MRVASRVREMLGTIAIATALALASPGVRATQADDDFSHDPTLEPALASKVEVGESCAARQQPVVTPLRGMPVLVAGAAGEEGNSLNGRGYNIGKTEPSADLQRLRFEARRHSH